MVRDYLNKNRIYRSRVVILYCGMIFASALCFAYILVQGQFISSNLRKLIVFHPKNISQWWKQ